MDYSGEDYVNLANTHSQHVSSNKVQTQSAVTPQRGRQYTQLAADDSDYRTHKMK